MHIVYDLGLQMYLGDVTLTVVTRQTGTVVHVDEVITGCPILTHIHFTFVDIYAAVIT